MYGACVLLKRRTCNALEFLGYFRNRIPFFLKLRTRINLDCLQGVFNSSNHCHNQRIHFNTLGYLFQLYRAIIRSIQNCENQNLYLLVRGIPYFVELYV
jgi:hypothetical protein